MAPIFIVSGPPGVGKTTFSKALLQRFPLGFHLPVDDMREWVLSGREEPIPWTDESERQFRIAEEASMAVAKTYNDGGFTVAIDHCRNPKRMDALTEEHLRGLRVVKVLLLPDLDTNLQRNLARTDKDFDPAWLEGVIRSTNENYRLDVEPDWIVVDNSNLSVEGTLDRVLGSLH